MSDFFKGIVGWERHGSEMMLRMNLTQPHITHVWPGSPSVSEPVGEKRLLTQMLLTRADVRRAVSGRWYEEDFRFSAGDIALLRRALNEPPRPQKTRHHDGPQRWM
jgi:hypothetical protein